MSTTRRVRLLWLGVASLLALLVLLALLRAYGGGALALQLMGGALPGCL